MKLAYALLAVAVALTLLLEPFATVSVRAAPPTGKEGRWRVQGLKIQVGNDAYQVPLPLTVTNQSEIVINPCESDVIVDTEEGLRIVFHLREYDPTVKVDVIALRDVNLDLRRGTVRKLEKSGKWGWDWGDLFDKIACSGSKCTLKMRAGEVIDPWIYYDFGSATYVMDAQSDYVPVAYSAQATLQDPAGWYVGGNLLFSHVVAAKCLYSVSNGFHNFTFDVYPKSGVVIVPVEIHVPDGGFVAAVRFYNFTSNAWVAASPSYQFGLTQPGPRNTTLAWMWAPAAWSRFKASATDGTLYRQIIAFNYTWLQSRGVPSGGRVRLNVWVYAPLAATGDGKKTFTVSISAANNDLVLLHAHELYFAGNSYVVSTYTGSIAPVTVAVRAAVLDLSDKTNPRLVDKDSTTAWSLYVATPSRTPVFAANVGGRLDSVSGSSLPAAVWITLAASYNGSHLLLYRNGVLNAGRAASGALGSNSQPLQLARASVAGRELRGFISYVLLYGAAFTDAQHAQMAGSVFPSSVLLLHLDASYWNGTHLIDLSGYGYHAFIYGAARVPAPQPFLYVLKNRYSDGKLRVQLPSELYGNATVTVTDAKGRTVYSGAPSGPVAVACPTPACTVAVTLDKRALGRTVTYIVTNPPDKYAPHLFVDLLPDSANVAPKIPPPNTTITITHPFTGTLLTITYVSYSTDTPVHVAVNGTQLPTTVIPMQYLKKALNVRVVTAAEAMKAVIRSVQGGNLTDVRWEGGEKGGRLIFRVEAPSGTWIYTFIIASDRPSIVFINGAVYPHAMDLDALVNGEVEGWAYSGNMVVVKAQARSPVDVVVDFSGAPVFEALNAAIGTMGSAAATLAAAIVIAAAAALLRVLLGGSFDPVDFAKTVLVVAILMAVTIIAVQVVFWAANP
jgi:hypothetical protein